MKTDWPHAKIRANSRKTSSVSSQNWPIPFMDRTVQPDSSDKWKVALSMVPATYKHYSFNLVQAFGLKDVYFSGVGGGGGNSHIKVMQVFVRNFEMNP